jgi:hypothetical protein
MAHRFQGIDVLGRARELRDQALGNPATTTYYDLHRCKLCADSDTPTPVQYATEVLGSPWQFGPAVLGNQHFGDGWLMGLEGTAEFSAAPVELGEMGNTRAWLVGYLAGRFSLENDWSTPTCVNPDLKGHTE